MPSPLLRTSVRTSPLTWTVLASLFALLLAAEGAWAQPVEVSHPVVNFLRRLEEKGVIDPGFWSTLPQDAAEVARVLNQAKLRESSLHSWDRRKLERFLDEFDPARRKKSLLHYEDSLLTMQGGFEFFSQGLLRDSTPKPEAFIFGSATPSVQATYDTWGYLVGSATIGMERSHYDRFLENYNPQRGMTYNASREGLTTFSRSVATFDGFRLVMGVGTPRLHVDAGQDWNQWGPGYWQHTTLSSHPYFWVTDSLAASPPTGFRGSLYPGYYRRGYRYPGEGPPLPQIRFTFRAAKFEYVKIIAQRTGMDKDSAATLIAHRLQLKLGNFRFGATEMLALGTRSPDMVTLLPFIPLKFAEHSGGDQDNAAMSGDAEWIWKGRGRFYGELFVDDFSGPPLDYWSNKLAWVLGTSLQDPFGLPAEVHIEYAHVDPYVYGHKFYNTALQSYGSLLGSSLPPNSRALSTLISFPVAGGVEGQAGWNFRQRDLKSKGSSIFDVHDQFADPPTKDFLAQDVETRNEFTASMEWNWESHFKWRGGLGYLWVESWRGNPGERYVTPTAMGEITLNLR